MKKASFAQAFLLSLLLIGTLLTLHFQSVLADTATRYTDKQINLHPPAGTPVPLGGYRLPFDRTQNSVISNGPGECHHTTRSAEAIDFSPRGWSDIYAGKAGTVHLNRN